MSDQVVYVVADEFADGGFDGGCVALQDGSAYDVHAALKHANGELKLDAVKDAHIIQVLDGYPAVQRAVPKPATKRASKGGDD